MLSSRWFNTAMKRARPMLRAMLATARAERTFNCGPPSRCPNAREAADHDENGRNQWSSGVFGDAEPRDDGKDEDEKKQDRARGHQ